MEFDDIFPYIGEFKLYQVLLYLLLGILSFFDGYQSIAMTFLGGSQDHWCKIDELQDFPYEQQKYVGIPYSTEDGEYSSCEYYDLPYANLSYGDIVNWNWTTSEYNNTQVLSCNQWVYDKSEFVDTAISEYNLVCDDSFKVDLVSSIFLSGILIGSPLSGALSDRFGRKIVLLVGCAFHLIFGVAAAFSPTYAWFVSLRFCLSVANSFAYLTGFVIIMELIGPSFRTFAGVCYQMWFAIGFMVLPGLAFFVRDFRNLQLVMAVPVVIITFVYIFLVPESPRWLVSQERYKDAEGILKKVAEVNNCQLPDKLEFTTPQNHKEEKGKFTDLFTHPVLCREILIIYLGWLTNSLVYYGLSLNTGALVGDVFLNTFISGLVEIPANIVCILGMQFVGRNPTLTWSYIVAGLTAFLSIPFLDNEDLSWLVTTLTMIGKAAITVSFSSIYVYTAELFPTPVRHLAVGSSSMMSRIGGLVAPFMGEPLMDVWLPMPSVIFGVMGLITGIFTCLLPETLNRKMPDTLEEAVSIGRLGKKQSESMYNMGAAGGADNDAYSDVMENSKYNTITNF